MEDKEAQKIAHENELYRGLVRILNETEGILPAGRASRIIRLFRELGYRKLPEKKPPKKAIWGK